MAEEYGMYHKPVSGIILGEYKGTKHPEFNVNLARRRYEIYKVDISKAKAHNKTALMRCYKISSDTLEKILEYVPEDKEQTSIQRFLTMALTYNPQPGWYY